MVMITEDSVGQRLDNFLIKHCKGVPKSRIYRAIRGGEVRVSKRRVKADYRLQLGDEVRIPPFRMAEREVQTTISADFATLIEESIIYEDRELIILNKPSGVAVHGGSGIRLGVIEALRLMRPHSEAFDLIHRLDRDTSGCLMVAKKRLFNKEMQQLFRDKRMEKSYLMIVHGECDFQRKTVEAPLQKNQLQSGERIVRVSHQGKPAVTMFSVQTRLNNATLLLAKPITGRTHQLRVHAQCLGHPIVGDEKYGDGSRDRQLHPMASKRLYLHAASLKFIDPRTEQPFHICATLDHPFANILLALKQN